MAYDWLGFKTAVMTAIAGAYAAAIPNGIYTSQATARMSWESVPGYPYVVVHMDEMPDGEWGITNDAFEPPVDVYVIVAETEAQDQDPTAAENRIPAALEAIKNGMRAYPFTTATLLRIEQMHFGPRLDVNEVVLGKNVPVLGGRIRFRFTLGETSG